MAKTSSKASVASRVNGQGFTLNDRTYLVRATSLADFDARAAALAASGEQKVSAETVASYREYVGYLVATKAKDGRSIGAYKAWAGEGRPSAKEFVAEHPRAAVARGLVKPEPKAAKAPKAAAPKASNKDARTALIQALTLAVEAAQTL